MGITGWVATRGGRRFVAPLALATGLLIGLPLASPAPVTGSAPEPAGPALSIPATGDQVQARAGARTAVRYRVTRRYARAVDTSSLAAVNAAYKSQFEPYLSQPTGYDGAVGGCFLGSQSAASRAGTRTALNFVRSLGGLAPVDFSWTLNARSQATAVLMSANNQLSHHPSSSWRCWNPTASSNAARSNLAMSWPTITTGRAISLYMQEPGANNTAVGHRRWLMHPNTTQMGTGATNNANAMTVVGPTAARRPNPAYVGWPTAGYFPNSLEPARRWSLSAGDPRTDFRRARVRVYRASHGSWVRVPARKYAVQNGYARPTIVWQMGSVSRTASYKVVVRGIRKAGSSKRFRTHYLVRMFTPR